MLYLNTGTGPRGTLAPHEHPGPGAVWLDLVSATEAERAAAERATGLVVPAEADLAEIESSSRLARDGDVLTLSTPMAYPGPNGTEQSTPLGFVLSPEHLLTIRFAEVPVFEHFAAKFDGAPGQKRSADAFVGLVEAIVDRLADALEHLGAELDAMSRAVFQPPSRGQKPVREDRKLQATLRGVGQAGDQVSKIRDSLLGMQRLSLYVHDVAASWFPQDLLPRLLTIRQDLASLADYDSQLTTKVQFLLDATLGFINIEQNNGIKVLTVASVVGIPPTLIVLSAVLPLIWLRRKGWI